MDLPFEQASPRYRDWCIAASLGVEFEDTIKTLQENLSDFGGIDVWVSICQVSAMEDSKGLPAKQQL